MSAANSEDVTATTTEPAENQNEAIETRPDGIRFVAYGTEKELPYLPAIRQLISKDLSEPYSIYVYRYFLYQWPELCYMVASPRPLLDRSSR